MSNRHQEMIDGLREFADWLESKGSDVIRDSHTTFYVFCNNKDEFAKTVKKIGGKTVKSSDGVYYSLRRNFGTAVTLDVTIQHQFLCERVKVGEKVIPAKPETVVPAQPERVEEVYEWKCPPSVLAGE